MSKLVFGHGSKYTSYYRYDCKSLIPLFFGVFFNFYLIVVWLPCKVLVSFSFFFFYAFECPYQMFGVCHWWDSETTPTPSPFSLSSQTPVNTVIYAPIFKIINLTIVFHRYLSFRWKSSHFSIYCFHSRLTALYDQSEFTTTRFGRFVWIQWSISISKSPLILPFSFFFSIASYVFTYTKPNTYYYY